MSPISNLLNLQVRDFFPDIKPKLQSEFGWQFLLMMDETEENGNLHYYSFVEEYVSFTVSVLSQPSSQYSILDTHQVFTCFEMTVLMSAMNKEVSLA